MTALTREHHHLHLGAGALASGKFERSRLLLVRRGYVWVTQEGRPEDFWLHAGDALIVQPGRTIVVEAVIVSEIFMENRSKPGAGLWFKVRCFAARGLLQRGFARLARLSHMTVRQGGH